MFSRSSKAQSSASPRSFVAGPKSSAARGATFSVIGADVVITGNITASVDLHIDGRVDGDISCAALVQGADSRIKGHVEAETATLAGLVEGSITASTLIIESGARITGDVSYESISIATGGQVEGRFTHKGGIATGELKLITG